MGAPMPDWPMLTFSGWNLVRSLPAADYKLAEASARKAICNCRCASQAHQVLGEVLFRYDHDSKAAENEFERALVLNSSDSTSYLRYAGILLDENRLNDALTQIDYALALDPIFPTDVKSNGRPHPDESWFLRSCNSAIGKNGGAQSRFPTGSLLSG